jgi:hypothetical protein
MDERPSNADCADVWNHDATLGGLFDHTRNRLVYYWVGRSLLEEHRRTGSLFPSRRRIRGIASPRLPIDRMWCSPYQDRSLLDNPDFGTLIRFSSRPSFAPSMSIYCPLLPQWLKVVASNK